MIRLFAKVSVLILVVAACGGASSEPATNTADQPSAVDSQPDDTQPASTQPADTQTAEDPADQQESPAPAGGNTGGGTATVTLENGEVFEFAILCSLNPAEVGDTEFEFSLVSYDDPFNLDVSQFTKDAFNGAANISIYDSTTFATTWEANTFFGGEVELVLNGTTVTGNGVFLKGDDAEGPGVRGDLLANC
jgi:hypothetical protein